MIFNKKVSECGRFLDGYEWEYHYDKTRGGSSIKMSDICGDCELTGAYTTYEKAREDLINSIIKYINNNGM